MPQIVFIDVSVETASEPNLLLERGAILSFGGTTLASGEYGLLSGTDDYINIQSPSGTATPDGLFTTAMVDSYFAQGDGYVYVLELGTQEGTAAEVAALTAYLETTPSFFSAVAVPPSWCAEPAFVTLAKQYVADNSEMMFFIETVLGQYSALLGVKSIISNAGYQDIAYTGAQFTMTVSSAIKLLYEWVNNDPSAVNKAASFAFREINGSTPWPDFGQASAEATLKTDYVNFVASGVEGGLSTTDLCFWGMCMDGNPIEYWYAVMHALIGLRQTLAYTIMTGVNNRTNPLEYDQAGINQLTTAANTFCAQEAEYNLIQGGYTVTATDFYTYVSENPDDYGNGVYKGITVTITPKVGLRSITVGMVVNMTPTSSSTSTTTTTTD